jgi:hypothetical protein
LVNIIVAPGKSAGLHDTSGYGAASTAAPECASKRRSMPPSSIDPSPGFSRSNVEYRPRSEFFATCRNAFGPAPWTNRAARRPQTRQAEIGRRLVDKSGHCATRCWIDTASKKLTAHLTTSNQVEALEFFAFPALKASPPIVDLVDQSGDRASMALSSGGRQVLHRGDEDYWLPRPRLHRRSARNSAGLCVA